MTIVDFFFRYSWKWFFLEHDITPYSRIGSAIMIGRTIALWFSAYFTILQCLTLSVHEAFALVTLFDVYLLLDWYIRINSLIYIDGVAVTDRRIVLQDWIKTKSFWDIITLCPFDVSKN